MEEFQLMESNGVREAGSLRGWSRTGFSGEQKQLDRQE